VCELIPLASRKEKDPVPLVGNIFIGLLQPVGQEHHRIIAGSVHHDVPLHIKAGSLVEINPSAGGDGKCRKGVDISIVIHQVGFVILPGLIFQGGALDKVKILPPGNQRDHLLIEIDVEPDAVLDHHGEILAVGIDRHFDKDENAVVGRDFQVINFVSGDTVHIQPETRKLATSDLDT